MVWPSQKPISVRISANDWVGSDGITPDDAVAIARLLRAGGADIIDVSAGQTSINARPIYGRMFQTPFSDRIRNEVGIATDGGRQHLRARPCQLDPDGGACGSVLPCPTAPRQPLLDAACGSRALGYTGETWPKPYLAGRDQLHRLAGRTETRDGARVMRVLDGRHALITGGGTGIGAAIAAKLFERRRRHFSSRDAEQRRCERVASSLPGTHAVVADVTKEAQTKAMVEAARAAHGPIDILIANAGAAESAPDRQGRLRPLAADARRKPDGRVSLGAGGAARLVAARGCLPLELSSPLPRPGIKGYPYVAAYCAAKHGVVGLARALAAELALARHYGQRGVSWLHGDAALGRRSAQHRRQDWTIARRRSRRPCALQPARAAHPTR